MTSPENMEDAPKHRIVLGKVLFDQELAFLELSADKVNACK
jgi:hypothetical protein